MFENIVKNVIKNVVRIELDKRTNETQKIAIEAVASLFDKNNK